MNRSACGQINNITGILVMLVMLLVVPNAHGAGLVSAGTMATGRDLHTATLLANGKVLVTGGTKSSITFTASCELYDPATNSWSPAGSMAVARNRHTATLLPNGKVLVAGGRGNAGPMVYAELYDPATNSWSPAGQMATARQGHTATQLGVGGYIYIIGGESTGSFLSSVEIYDWENNTWMTTSVSMNIPRAYHTTTLLPDGTILVSGGDNGQIINSAEVYQSELDAWVTVGSMANTRNHHTATLRPDGKVMVVGGYSPGNGVLASCEIYDPVSKIWTAGPALANARQRHTATLLPGGRIMVTGGEYYNELEVYNPDLNIWQTLLSPTMASGKNNHTATLLTNGDLLLAGGTNVQSTTPTNIAEIYSNKVSPVSVAAASMPSGRSYHTTLLLHNGKVLVTGGSVTDTSSVEYAPVTNSWGNSTAMASARTKHTLTMLQNGTAVVIGGYTTSGPTAGVERYAPSAESPFSNIWTPLQPLVTARGLHTATLLSNGKVLVTGGMSGSYFLDSCELYDPDSNSWSQAASLNAVRSGHTATLLPSGKVLVAGGYTTTALNTAELYNPETDSWSPAGTFTAARSQHTATLLPSGKVLLTGGLGTSDAVTSAVLYDPASNSWTDVGSLATARYNHSAVLLNSGKVLVAGGTSVGPNRTTLAGIEVYDPAAELWSNSGLMAIERSFFGMTLLLDGNVLVTGGRNSNGTLSYAERMNTNSGFNAAWQPVIVESPVTVELKQGISLRGSGFGGVLTTEASGGGTNSSATNYPLVQLRSFENDQLLWLTPTLFTAGAFISAPVSQIQAGPARLTVFANGIASKSVVIMVKRVDQAITFAPLINRVTGDPSFQLTAAASSGLPVSYTSSDVSVATVSGATVTITGVGTTTITAQQPGTALYNAASDVPQSFTVLPYSHLAVNINGYGTVSGTSAQQTYFYCNKNLCSNSFHPGDQISLTATPYSSDFIFDGWFGDCNAATGTCDLMLNQNRQVTATFIAKDRVLLIDNGYAYGRSSPAAAYGGNLYGTTPTIKMQAATFIGNLALDKDVAVVLEGGYNNTFQSNPGWSVINGTVTIRSGSLTIDRVILQ